MASRKNVPVFGVYVDGTGPLSTLPNALPRSRVIGWSWPSIADLIDKAMVEGKNKPTARLI